MSAPADLTLREEQRLSPMRQAIADRLGTSYREAIHVTASREISVEPFLDAVDRAKDRHGDRIGFIDVLLRAVSHTLAQHPGFNAHFEDGTHLIFEEHNVGIAVDVDAGLLAPVLADVASRSLAEIADERERVVERVRTGQHTMTDLRNGTFTVSNLGPLGVDAFTPIINPPQVAILGIGRVRDRIRPIDGEVVTTPEARFDLSFDHRVVDGADAARFLSTLAEQLRAAVE